MGLLDRLLRRKGDERVARGTEVAAAPCSHVVLTTRWDSAEDLGDESKVSSYRCEACGESFTREEGERLRAGEAERLIERLSTDD